MDNEKIRLLESSIIGDKRVGERGKNPSLNYLRSNLIIVCRKLIAIITTKPAEKPIMSATIKLILLSLHL